MKESINQNPSIHIVEKIAQVLNVEVKTLINGEMIETQAIETEWMDLINHFKKSGIKKEDIQEFKTLIEFIKWRNSQAEQEIKTCCHEGKNE